MDSKLWVDKYRPKNVNNISSHSNIIKLLDNMKKNEINYNLLCYGPSGCGKSTTMLAYGNSLYNDKENINIMKINASDERGISVIRDKIFNFIQTESLTGTETVNHKYSKMIILDEADYMTEDAQFAITNIMDQYKDVLFVFICNYIHKIHNVIQSRCQILYFNSIPIINIKNILNNIIRQEKIDISKDALQVLCELTKYDLRSSLYMLQSLHFSNKRLTPSNIYKYNQFPTDFHIKKILEIIKKQNMNECYKYILCIIKEKGLLLKNIIYQIYNNVINMNLSEKKLREFIKHFALLESYLTYEHTNNILVGNLVSGLYNIKDEIQLSDEIVEDE